VLHATASGYVERGTAIDGSETRKTRDLSPIASSFVLAIGDGEESKITEWSMCPCKLG